MTADLCQFGCWCPKSTHARTLCREPAVGTALRYNGQKLRMCEPCGRTYEGWENRYGTTFTRDNQPALQAESQLSLFQP